MKRGKKVPFITLLSTTFSVSFLAVLLELTAELSKVAHQWQNLQTKYLSSLYNF
jgi:hypothetical protein